jgi:hypothetical protein
MSIEIQKLLALTKIASSRILAAGNRFAFKTFGQPHPLLESSQRNSNPANGTASEQHIGRKI